MAASASCLIAALSVGPALTAVPAAAQSPRQSALEARLAQLEAAVPLLHGELATLRAPPLAADVPASAKAAPALPPEAERRLATLETAKPADGLKIGNTSFKIGGHVRVNAAGTRYNDG